MAEQQKFKIVLPILKTRIEIQKSEDGTEREVRFVQGKASSTDKDLHGDKMAPEAIKTMAESLKFHEVPLNADHDTTWSAEIGPIVKLEVTEDNDLVLEAQLSEMSKANDLWYALTKSNKKLGLSIGGYVKEYEMVKEESEEEGGTPHWYRLYKDIDLDHVAVTSTPANPKTWVSAISKSLDKSQDEILMKKFEEKQEYEIAEKQRKDTRVKDLAVKLARKVQDIESSLLLDLTESVLLTFDSRTIEKIEDFYNNILEKRITDMKDINSLEAEKSEIKKDETEVKPVDEVVETPAAPENEPEKTEVTETPETEVETEKETTEETEEKKDEVVEEKPTETESEKTEEKSDKSGDEEKSEEKKDEQKEEEVEEVKTEEEKPDGGEPKGNESEDATKSIDDAQTQLLKSVDDMAEVLKKTLAVNEALNKELSELKQQPATRKTVEVTKGLGTEEVEETGVTKESLTKEMNAEIETLRKNASNGDPALFSNIQKVRATYNKKIIALSFS
jgi:hypothetical protein